MLNDTIFKTLKYFPGLWSFERSISNPVLHIKGVATLEELSEGALSYYECGTYTVDQVAYDFFQKRFFSYDMSALYIYKNDHSLLHKFDFKGNHTPHPITLNHTHLCGVDTYDCTLILKSDRTFDFNYKINGKNKDYEIQTTYTKD